MIELAYSAVYFDWKFCRKNNTGNELRRKSSRKAFTSRGGGEERDL
jgi:hypothetical protein